MTFYVSRSRTHFVVLNSFCNGIFAYFYIALQMTTSACVATETHAKMSQLKIAINSTPQHWAVFVNVYLSMFSLFFFFLWLILGFV